MSIILPPATTATDITFTIGKKQTPYFLNWYNDLRKDIDTPSTFVKRVIKRSYNEYTTSKGYTDMGNALALIEADLKVTLAQEIIIIDGE